ncbi:MAG TPA: class I SAM-dependent methyltransferase [Anaerolineales bacterium]|nr:class I SAM-dependent methyltransferase [Anaerolineales bacterium]
MDQAIVQQLLDLNRRFYTEHGGDFSATRARLQNGVLRVIDTLCGNESILDLGCGNGELARTLARRGHRGPYLGLDFSLPLLEEVQHEAFPFPVQFRQADLTSLHWDRTDAYDIVLSFAVLHHIPSLELRLQIIQKVHGLLKSSGMFIHSNWQFLNSPRLKARIQPWEIIDLQESDVDADDYLLDWRRGSRGLRYVHRFDESELADLAKVCGFEIIETFYSDGENGRLSLYQTWKKVLGS